MLGSSQRGRLQEARTQQTAAWCGFALGLSQWTGSRGKRWTWPRRRGREAGLEAVPASWARESGVTLFFWNLPSGALVWPWPGRPLGEVLPCSPPPPSAVSSVGCQGRKGALRTCCTVWGWGAFSHHLSFRLHVAGSGTSILACDSLGSTLDSLRPQVPLTCLRPMPAPELLGHPPSPVLVEPARVLLVAWGVRES